VGAGAGSGAAGAGSGLLGWGADWEEVYVILQVGYPRYLTLISRVLYTVCASSCCRRDAI
jgi:hypothetical protein